LVPFLSSQGPPPPVTIYITRLSNDTKHGGIGRREYIKIKYDTLGLWETREWGRKREIKGKDRERERNMKKVLRNMSKKMKRTKKWPRSSAAHTLSNRS